MIEPQISELRHAIRVEIHATAAELRALKRWWRTPPDARAEPPVTRHALHPLQRRATLLCMIIAHSRGRVHRAADGAAEQGAQLVEALAAMDRMRVQTPLLDASLRAAARAILARTERVATNSTHACVAPTVEHRA
jgi:hypothetical protein